MLVQDTAFAGEGVSEAEDALRYVFEHPSSVTVCRGV